LGVSGIRDGDDGRHDMGPIDLINVAECGREDVFDQDATRTVGLAATPFKLMATDFPAPTIVEKGILPKGMKFAGGVLRVTPTAGPGGI
jgi:hypothetical protein